MNSLEMIVILALVGSAAAAEHLSFETELGEQYSNDFVSCGKLYIRMNGGEYSVLNDYQEAGCFPNGKVIKFENDVDIRVDDVNNVVSDTTKTCCVSANAKAITLDPDGVFK